LRQTDWKTELAACNTEQAWTAFQERIHKLVDEPVPTRPRRTPNMPVWMNREVIRAVRRKRKMWKTARCGREEMAKYQEAVREATRKIWNAKRNFEKKLAWEKHGNSRPLISYLKGKTRNRETVGPLKNGDYNKITEDGEMADMFNDYFASVFTKEGNGPVPEEERMTFNTELQDIEVQREKVDEKIRKPVLVLLQDQTELVQVYSRIYRKRLCQYLLLYSGSH
jgi:hypothetical protein